MKQFGKYYRIKKFRDVLQFIPSNNPISRFLLTIYTNGKNVKTREFWKFCLSRMRFPPWPSLPPKGKAMGWWLWASSLAVKVSLSDVTKLRICQTLLIWIQEVCRLEAVIGKGPFYACLRVTWRGQLITLFFSLYQINYHLICGTVGTIISI